MLEHRSSTVGRVRFATLSTVASTRAKQTTKRTTPNTTRFRSSYAPESASVDTLPNLHFCLAFPQTGRAARDSSCALGQRQLVLVAHHFLQDLSAPLCRAIRAPRPAFALRFMAFRD